MSQNKGLNRFRDSKPESPRVEPPAVSEPQPTVETNMGRRTMSEFCLCPFCRVPGKDNGRHDKGALIRIYYKCMQCGHDWTADVTRPQPVAVDYRVPDDISTR